MFCSAKHVAEDIASLPYDQRLIAIKVLLELLVTKPLDEGKEIADKLLHALPGIASVKHLEGKDPRGVVVHVLSVIINKQYREAVKKHSANLKSGSFYIPPDLLLRMYKEGEGAVQFKTFAIEMDAMLEKRRRLNGIRRNAIRTNGTNGLA